MMRVILEPDTVAIVEFGREDDGSVTAQYFDLNDLNDLVPLPRRQVAHVLRILADQMDETADELETLEQS